MVGRIQPLLPFPVSRRRIGVGCYWGSRRPVRVLCCYPIDLGLCGLCQFVEVHAVVVVLVLVGHAWMVADEGISLPEPIFLLVSQLLPCVVKLPRIVGRVGQHRLHCCIIGMRTIRNRLGTCSHCDRPRQLLIDACRLCQDADQPGLQLVTGGLGGDQLDHVGLQGRAREHLAADGIDFEAGNDGVVSELRQAGLDRIDTVGSLAGCLRDRQRLLAMRIQIPASLADSLFGCLGRVATPGAEGRKFRDAIRRLERRLSAAAGGIEHLTNIAGVPSVDIGDADRHEPTPPLEVHIFGTDEDRRYLDIGTAVPIGPDVGGRTGAQGGAVIHQSTEQSRRVRLPLDHRCTQCDCRTRRCTTLRTLHQAVRGSVPGFHRIRMGIDRASRDLQVYRNDTNLGRHSPSFCAAVDCPDDTAPPHGLSTRITGAPWGAHRAR